MDLYRLKNSSRFSAFYHTKLRDLTLHKLKSRNDWRAGHIHVPHTSNWCLHYGSPWYAPTPTDASGWPSFHQVHSTAENTYTSNAHNQSEGPRLGTDRRASSERSSVDDLEAQIEGQSTGNRNKLPLFFQRWGKYHYAGVAATLLVLHIVRSVYSELSVPDTNAVGRNITSIEYSLPVFTRVSVELNDQWNSDWAPKNVRRRIHRYI